jgi:ATP-dependent protease ClpP protease subunit
MPVEGKEYKHKLIYLNTYNTVNIRGAVNDDNVAKWSRELAKLKSGRGRHKPVYLVIDSPGGSITAGLNFINFVNQYKNVHTITMDAASMGSGIVQGVRGNRYYLPNSIMMFHRAKASVSGQVEEGELEQRLKMIKKLVLYMENINASRMSMPLKSYKDKVLNEWWLFGDDIGKANAGDSMVFLKCSDKLTKQREEVSYRSIFGLVKFLYSKCPLIKSPVSLRR